MEFSERLKTLENKHILQVDVAEKLGIFATSLCFMGTWS